MTTGKQSIRVRRVNATMMIRANRTVGNGYGEIYVQAGFRDADEFWHDAMSQPMEATEFARLLESHLLDPARTADEIAGRVVRIKTLILKSLRFALKIHEPWFIVPRGSDGDPLDLRNLMLRPREATQWALSIPEHSELVPPGLKAFLEARGPPAGLTSLPPRAAANDTPGPAPRVSEQKLTVFLVGLKKEAGKVPSQAEATLRAKAHFGANRVTRNAVCRVLIKNFSHQRPGPRAISPKIPPD
jgi:hypothetical protein